LRIYTSRRRDRRSWMAVLATCLGVYLLLALGFHWFLQPTVKNLEAAVPKPLPVAFVADPDRRPAEPTAPSRQSQRGVAQRPSSDAKQSPARAGAPATAETAEQDAVTPPKKEPKRKVARRAHDRSAQQAADGRTPWNFASSPSSSNYRPWF